MLKRFCVVRSKLKGRGWFCLLRVLLLLPVLASCDFDDGGVDTGDGNSMVKREGGGEWQKVINDCISAVERSEAVFYRRGQRVTGKQLASEMRRNLEIILQHKSIPDPFGRNTGVLLCVITTHEGYAMDGITGPPTPYEVEVNGERMKLYDWLKRELGLGRLPGEEEGHEILLPLYEAVVPEELLKRWDDYLERCIEVTRGARECRFYLNGKYFSPTEAAGVFASNRQDTIQKLINPKITHPDDVELYTPEMVLRVLVTRPVPRAEEFSDPRQLSKEVEVWAFESSRVDCNGYKEDLIKWLIRKVGSPPPMPTLKQKNTGSG